MAAVSLPYSHIDCSLRALTGQAEGRLAVDGLHGAIYHVTTLSDDRLGSLRGVQKNLCGLFLKFQRSLMTCQKNHYSRIISKQMIWW